MKAVNALLQTSLLCFSFLGYGPVQDHSEFVSARLTEDNRTVLFTFHRFMYKPAEGWRAFPDGGIPRYVEDVNIIAAYDLESHSPKILHREKNTKWQPGSGLFTIQGINGAKALLIQGGQLRNGVNFETRFLLLDMTAGNYEELDLKSDLAKHQRSPDQIYLVDGAGTLLFITSAKHQATGARATEQQAPELWVRTSTGRYLKAASSALYERTRDGEVIYWEPSTRSFKAFSIATGQTRAMPDFRSVGYQDVTQGVSLASDRRTLQLGQKIDGQWNYRPVDIKTDKLK